MGQENSKEEDTNTPLASKDQLSVNSYQELAESKLRIFFIFHSAAIRSEAFPYR